MKCLSGHTHPLARTHRVWPLPFVMPWNAIKFRIAMYGLILVMAGIPLTMLATGHLELSGPLYWLALVAVVGMVFAVARTSRSIRLFRRR